MANGLPKDSQARRAGLAVVGLNEQCKVTQVRLSPIGRATVEAEYDTACPRDCQGTVLAQPEQTLRAASYVTCAH
eukprot:2794083-Amphidinium_carterae.3